MAKADDDRLAAEMARLAQVAAEANRTAAAHQAAQQQGGQ